MIIELLKDVKNDEFVSFKKKKWVYADKEHYGDTPPDLTKYEYTYVAKENGKIIGAIDILIFLFSYSMDFSLLLFFYR